MLPALCCLVALAALTGSRGSAWAATGFPPSTKVVLFTPPYSDPLVARLEAELAAVGIAVRRLATPSESQAEAAITREIAAGASAAIRVIPHSRGTEVWTGDTTARMLRRRSIRADTSDAALSVIALRTVEFLRASLLDVKRRGPASPPVAKAPGDAAAPREADAPEKGVPPERTNPPEKGESSAGPVAESPATPPAETATARPEAPTPLPAEPPPEKPVEQPVEGATEPPAPPMEPPPSVESTPLHLRFEIAAGPAVVTSPGGIPPIASAAATGRVWLSDYVGMELMAVVPMMSGRLTNAEGAIEFQAMFFGGGATFRLTPPGRWIADATLGVTAILFRTAGSSVGTVGGAPNLGQTDSAWKGAAHARIGGGVEINRWLMVRADALVGMTPSSRIMLAYQVTNSNGVTTLNDRATWGPTFAAGSVSLQATW